jgi:transposase
VTEEKEPRKGRKRKETEVPEEVRAEILRLHEHYGSREIVKRVGLSRRTVRDVLAAAGKSTLPPSSTPEERAKKLEPFREKITELVKKGLTATRILREIRDPDPKKGYQGGRTILASYVRSLRVQLALLPEKRKKVRRRFETRPGEELQLDWSPYWVLIDGKLTRVHALGCLLCHSRKLHVRFYKDERQSTLLEGLALAFEAFEGVTIRSVLDNMATAVLGRIGSSGKPLWNPRFLEFCKHYGTEAFACKVKDSDRKGKKEKSFRLVEDDFLKGKVFVSWEDLNEQVRVWLDENKVKPLETGNWREHRTTRKVPNEEWKVEREFLIALADKRFAVAQEEARLVDADSTLSIEGTRYSVPCSLANESVAVRLYAEHFEVLDKLGRVAFSRRYVEARDKGKLMIDPSHYATLPRRPRGGSSVRMDEAFLERFPMLAALVDGLRLRMKTLAHVHFRALLRLADRYGEATFLVAATRAQKFRRFDANAVARILEREHPLSEPPLTPEGGGGIALADDGDETSLERFGDLDEEDGERGE